MKFLKVFFFFLFLLLTTNTFAANIPYIPTDDGITYDYGTSLSRINDGNISTAGADDYQVHPGNAIGKTITMTFANVSDIDSTTFYNRATNPCCASRIDGAQMIFKDSSGIALYTYTFASSTGEVLISNPTGTIHNVKTVELTNFQSDPQNFREISFNGSISVPIVNDLVLWLDADDASTLFSDNACTTAVSSGSKVGCWKDKSGQNNDVLQSNPADKPTYNTNILNTKPVLDFVDSASGNDDHLATVNAGQITANGSYTKFVVFAYDNLTSNQNLISSDTTGSALWGAGDGKIHTWNLAPSYGGLPGFLSSPNQLTVNKYYIAATRYDNVAGDGVKSILRLDGTQLDTDDAVHEHSSQKILIGSHGTNHGLDGKIAEALVYNRGLSDSEIAAMEEYLRIKWFAPLPKILINEVEYDPSPSGNDKNYEWIELHNTTTQSFSLSGATLSDNTTTFTFTGGTIASGGFLILANQQAGFQSLYPAHTADVILVPQLILSNTSDHLTFKDKYGRTLDYVQWENAGAGWNINGTTKPICRKNIPSVLDTDTSSDWMSNCNPTPGAINTLNQQPTNITLSNNSITENTIVVGNFTTSDADTSNTHTYTLVNGTESEDNAKFTLTNTGGLSFSSAPDFENPTDIGDTASNNTYTIRVKTTDNGTPNLSFEKSFVITVTNANETPTLADKTFSVAENASNNASVGTMTGSDVDSGSTLVYSITSGNTGSVFAINSTTGEITVADNANLDYETISSYTLTIEVSDGSLTTTATATINITDIDEIAPTCGTWTYTPATPTTGNITATLSGSTDTGGAGITTTGGTCTITTNNTTCSVDIVDNVGNTQTCTSPAATNIDRVAPIITTVSDKTFAEDGAITPIGITTDDASAVIVVSGLPTGLTYNATTKQIEGTPTTPNTPTGVTVTITATDALGNSSTETFVMKITDVTAPVITLNGSSTITLTTNASYTDSGATCSDNYDTTCATTQTGVVDTNTIGTYTIIYRATDTAGNNSTETRTVHIVSGSTPVLTLIGYTPVTIEAGDSYADSGATATDLEDGTITSQVVTSGSVNTAIVGTYTITYDVTDSSGNSATQIIRTIKVVDTTAPAIILTGDSILTLNRGQSFTDPGAICSDNVSCTVSVQGTVNTNQASEYTLVYTATDPSGNTSQVSRIVKVLGSNNGNTNSSQGAGGGYNTNQKPVIIQEETPKTDTSIQFLPTQSKAIPDGRTPSGQKVFTIQNRVTDYVCPKIVQVYTTDEINAIDIKNTNFHDDIRALIMFRGLEKDEKNLGQTFKEYQSYGVNLNTHGFRPYEHITRAEYVKMLVRSLSCRYTYLGKDTSYTDISQNDWYAEYIKFATEQGWISGYDDGTFKPNNPITRNEAAKIFSRAIRLQTASTITNPYLDVSEGSEFLPYIKSLRESGIMKGKTGNMFSPETYIPRTEASRMIYRTFLGGDI